MAFLQLRSILVAGVRAERLDEPVGFPRSGPTAVARWNSRVVRFLLNARRPPTNGSANEGDAPSQDTA